MHLMHAVELARRGREPDSGGSELQHHEAQRHVQDDLRAPCPGGQDGQLQLQSLLSRSEPSRNQAEQHLIYCAAQARAGAQTSQHCGQLAAVQVKDQIEEETYYNIIFRCHITARPNACKVDWYLNNKPLSPELVQDGVLSLTFSPELIGKNENVSLLQCHLFTKTFQGQG